MKLLVTAAVLAIPITYYLVLGVGAFRKELGDFVPTPDAANPASRQQAAAMGAVAVATHWHLDDGSRQRAFYRPGTNGAVILYIHGSPGRASGFHEYVAAMARSGFGALAIDMPGYGESAGLRRWDDAFVESVSKGLDFLETQGVDSRGIGGLGYSMGANTIVKAALIDKRIAALVLLAGYTNLTDQLQNQFRRRVPGMGYFARLAAGWSGVPVGTMDTAAGLAALDDRPVFVISGTEDRAIPVEMPRALAAIAQRSELWLIEGARHADFAQVAGDEFYDRLATFWGGSLVGQTAAKPAKLTKGG